MAQQLLLLGTTPNDDTGDPLYVGGGKINTNFNEIYEGKYLSEVSLASAATTDIGASTSMRLLITGTTTITSFGTSPNRLRFLRFQSALTLTHSGATLSLPGGVNISVSAGDRAIAVSDGSGNWTVQSFHRANGKPVTAPQTGDIQSLVWTAHTPTIAPSATPGVFAAGTITAGYVKVGRLVTEWGQFTITDNDTGSGLLTASLAFTSAHEHHGLGRNSSDGLGLIVRAATGSNLLFMGTFAATPLYPGITGKVYRYSITYEATT